MIRFVCLLLFFSSSAHAQYLFNKFNGKYSIAQRWCEKTDTDCGNLTGVQIGYDASRKESFLIESYKDLRTAETWFFEGKRSTGHAYAEGDFGKTANWFYQEPQSDGSVNVFKVFLKRASPKAQVFYTTEDSNFRAGKAAHQTRKYRLQPLP